MCIFIYFLLTLYYRVDIVGMNIVQYMYIGTHTYLFTTIIVHFNMLFIYLLFLITYILYII